jgi:hypothetical protein
MKIQQTSASRPPSPRDAVSSNGDSPALPAELTKFPLEDRNAWQKATLKWLREKNYSLVTLLSKHKPAQAGLEIERRTVAALNLRPRGPFGESLTSSELRSLHEWLMLESSPDRVELDLSCQQLEQEQEGVELEKIIGTQRVSALNLSHCSLTLSDSLCKAMHDNDSITSLKLKGNTGTDCGEAIATMLRRCSKLTTLNLSSCELTPADIQTIVEALLDKRTLQVLDLRGNVWGQIGLQALAELVAADTPLRSLRLAGLTYSGGHKARDDDFGIFCHALQHNTTLQHIAIGVPFNGAQARSLGDALAQNRTLERLDLCRLKGGSGPHKTGPASIVLKGMAQNRELRSLSLGKFHFTKEDCDTLCAWLRDETCRLTRLELRLERWHGEMGIMPSEVQEAICSCNRLTSFSGRSTQERRHIRAALEQKKQILAAGGRAIVFLANAAGHRLPRDLAVPLNIALSDIATGRTVRQLVEAALGTNALPHKV